MIYQASVAASIAAIVAPTTVAQIKLCSLFTLLLQPSSVQRLPNTAPTFYGSLCIQTQRRTSTEVSLREWKIGQIFCVWRWASAASRDTI